MNGIAASGIVVGIVVGLAMGCSAEPVELECRFGDEHSVARSVHRFDGLRLVDNTLVWSAPDGLFVRSLDSAGAPAGPAIRIDAGCDGGIDALPDEDGVVVACVRRPTDKGAGAALVLHVRQGVLHRRTLLGSAGRDARGIDLVRTADGWAVAWHDGSPGAWVVWLARLDAALEPHDEPRLLSSTRVAAGRPSVWANDESIWVTWSETWLEAGFPRGQIMVWPGRGVPQRVAEVDVLEPSPLIHRDDRSAILFFRDVRRPYRRVGLFALRLDERWRPMGEVVRVGRADSDDAFTVVPCAGALATVTPRTWDEDLLVGINLLDDRLEKRIPEQQVYEWSARFSTSAVRCAEDSLLLVVGEHGRGPDIDVAAHAITLRCE